MIKRILVIQIIFLMFSCTKRDDVDLKDEGVFKYENVSFRIPNNFKRTNVKGRWNSDDGITLSIEKEFSKSNIDEYITDSINVIKKFYPTYELTKKKKISDNKVLIEAGLILNGVEMKTYMVIFSFEDFKVAVMLLGKSEILNKEVYIKFLNTLISDS